jgi:5-methylthioadenosine/S-adenosylhomocysteine deaminase
MSDQDDARLMPVVGPSRRGLIKSAAALAAGAAAVPALSGFAPAQDAGDAELARLQVARRILIKGGVVLTLDRQVGDFAKADILIEDGKIREVRPDLGAVAGAAVIDATNRIVTPGFVDTHSHSYQGLLRSIMPDGVLEPDYNRDVQNKLTPAYAPAEVHAGVLMTALGAIDMGTTTIVDLCQISHTPEHSDACVAALRDAGIRAVYGYSRGAGPAAQYPQDIGRLQRTYFNSKDQLLTLALGAGLDAKIFAAARDAGVPAVLHLVAANTSETFLELGRAGLLRPGDEYIHCLNLTPEA